VDAPDPDFSIFLERRLAPVMLSVMLRPSAIAPRTAMLSPLKAAAGFSVEAPAWLVKALTWLALEAARVITLPALFRSPTAAGGRSLRPGLVIPAAGVVPARAA
jgi:hypothetical protein